MTGSWSPDNQKFLVQPLSEHGEKQAPHLFLGDVCGSSTDLPLAADGEFPWRATWVDMKRFLLVTGVPGSESRFRLYRYTLKVGGGAAIDIIGEVSAQPDGMNIQILPPASQP